MKQPSRLCFIALAALLTHISAHAVGDACTRAERQVWACEANGKLYTLCASQDLGPQTGYLQYRVYKGATQEFAFPASQRHPKGLFKLSLMSKGAELRFSNGVYDYEIYEPLSGTAEISVRKNRKTLASFSCTDFTDTLTLTSTQNFLATLGVYDK